MSHRPYLHRLSECAGILPHYLSFDGRETRHATDRTREAILAAMGFDASSEAGCEAALRTLESARENEVLPPSRIIAASSGHGGQVHVRAPLPGCEVEWNLAFHEESGNVHELQGVAAPMAPYRWFDITLPVEPELGCHDVRLWLKCGGVESYAEQRLIVTPDRCVQPRDISGKNVFGVWANLYTIRSKRNWGVGDLGDLGLLARTVGSLGGGFVLINPIHATKNRLPDISPYQPLSRIFRNFLYLDIEAVAELGDCDAVRKKIASPEFQETLTLLRAHEHVDYAKVAAIKEDCLRLLFHEFWKKHRGKDNKRGRAYERYLRKNEPLVSLFAIFLALEKNFAAQNAGDWQAWPAEFKNPDSPSVKQFALDRAAEIEFHRYVQFEIDHQLERIARDAKTRKLTLGIIHDLAIGTAACGFDLWQFGDAFVGGVNLGAPPDDLGPTGQNWGLPPINPLRLRTSGFAYWTALLQASFAHAGGIRLDHAMGLLRQFWVPRGFSGDQGAYVAFPHEELFALLALESVRHGAIVVGEDLGTVPDGFSALLERWGVLSTKVVYFEREGEHRFRAARSYPERALVTVNTHDMVPLAGYRDGVELQTRHQLGIISNEIELRGALEDRQLDGWGLMQAMVEAGHLPAKEQLSQEELLQAICRFLSETPSWLAAISLDDLAGETEPVNVPGVGQDRHPSWSRKMQRDLEEIIASATFSDALAALRRSEHPADD